MFCPRGGGEGPEVGDSPIPGQILAAEQMPCKMAEQVRRAEVEKKREAQSEARMLKETARKRAAAQDAAATTEENNQVVIRNRKSEYGTTEYQIENIIENGLSAEQTRVQAIKDKYPKE